MPKSSNIQQLRELALFLGFDSLMSQNSLLDEDEILAFMTLLEVCRKGIETNPVPKSMSWYYNILCSPEFDEGRFRCQLRMDRESFNYLVHMLKGE